jgi:threonine/homoserine/homoserine lactone efflux protein
METLSTLMSIAAIWAIAAVTPGPNFVIAVQAAVARPRRHAMAVVAGICTGTLIWGTAGFFGVSALFALAPWLYLGLKIVGGAYLVYLGLRLIAASFRAGPRPAAPGIEAAASGWAAWRLGLLTNCANPKTAAFVTSLFATTMPADPANFLGLLAVGAMVAISLTWYSGVAWVFASAAAAALYGRIAATVDRLAGGLFVLFGAKLALDR